MDDDIAIHAKQLQDQDCIIGTILRRTIYIEDELGTLIEISIINSSEYKKREIFENIFLKKKTLGKKIELFEKINGQIFKDEFKDLITKLKEVNAIRNAVAHHIVMSPFDKEKTDFDLTKSYIEYANKKVLLNDEFRKSYIMFTHKINFEIMDIIKKLIQQST